MASAARRTANAGAVKLPQAKATRARTVSLANLSRPIDTAVALAYKRYDVTLGPGDLIHHWQSQGRILRHMNLRF